jgi:hypothetical protein
VKFYLAKPIEESRAEESVPVEEDLSLAGWVTDQPTFNYKLPCDIDKTVAVAFATYAEVLCVVFTNAQAGCFNDFIIHVKDW